MPAAIVFRLDGSKRKETWCSNGSFHRDVERGAAKIWYDVDGEVIREEFWVRGQHLTEFDTPGFVTDDDTPPGT